MKEHGTFSVVRSGQALLIRCEGTWNYEAAVHYSAVVLEHAKSMGPGPWCTLADLREWDLGTPDAIRPVVELYRKLTELGRSHAAAAIGDSQLRRTVTDQIRSYVNDDDAPDLHYFRTPEEARAWLEGLGYSLE